MEETVNLLGGVMGMNIREATKKSALIGRGGVRQTALETTPRPKDAAAGTQSHEAHSRAIAANGQAQSKPSSAKLDMIA